MNARAVRYTLPMFYAAAMALAVIFANGTVVAAVAIVGAMVVAAGFVLLSGPRGAVSDRPERAARRAARLQRRSR